MEQFSGKPIEKFTEQDDEKPAFLSLSVRIQSIGIPVTGLTEEDFRKIRSFEQILSEVKTSSGCFSPTVPLPALSELTDALSSSLNEIRAQKEQYIQALLSLLDRYLKEHAPSGPSSFWSFRKKPESDTAKEIFSLWNRIRTAEGNTDLTFPAYKKQKESVLSSLRERKNVQIAQKLVLSESGAKELCAPEKEEPGTGELLHLMRLAEHEIQSVQKIRHMLLPPFCEILSAHLPKYQPEDDLPVKGTDLSSPSFDAEAENAVRRAVNSLRAQILSIT